MAENKEKTSENKKFAVIKTGGKQYIVRENDVLDVELLDISEGDKIKFDDVLLVQEAGKTQIGTPIVEKAVVTATAVRDIRGEKQIIFKYKAKKNYRVKTGHRQNYTKVKIDKIEVK